MKKLLSLLLAAAIAAVPLGMSVSASDNDSKISAARALGIIETYENGTYSLSSTVTRGEFARMLVAASGRGDTITGKSSTSPFKDVSYTRPDAGYIQTVASEGVLSGYSDGSFRPDSPLKTEDAVAAALRLLGYSGGTFSSQLDKARSLGLLAGLSLALGGPLTTEEASVLLYQTLNAKTASGQIYAATVGLASATGSFDYGSIMESTLQGPFLCNGSLESLLPFSVSGAQVYLNGNKSKGNAIEQNDVVYYNASMKTVWAYRKRVTGVYTAASPSTASPSSATVAGQSYSLGSDASYRLSDLGGIGVGQTVTLLLGRDGSAVYALSGSVSSRAHEEVTGVVTGVQAAGYTDGYGKSEFSYQASVIGTDGVLRSYPVGSKNTLKEGDVVLASSLDNSAQLTKLPKSSLKGIVGANGTVGTVPLAADVQILDYVNSGAYGTVTPERLAGISLSNTNVLFYSKNAAGEIDRLILKNTTGDMGSFGLITSVTAITQTIPGSQTGNPDASGGQGSGDAGEDEEPEEIVTGYTYTYLLNGQTMTGTAGPESGIRTGGASFTFKNGVVSKVTMLSNLPLSGVSGLNATLANGGKAAVADNAAVYVQMGSDYLQAGLATVSDTAKYTLTGYTDKTSTGRKIRVILAKMK